MNCNACGTRVGRTERYCPNCGRSLKVGAAGPDGDSPLSQTLSPSSAKIPTQRQGLRDGATSRSGRAKARKRGAGESSSGTTQRGESAPEVTLDSPVSSGLGTGEIRSLICDQPDRLEPGLSIYTDSKAAPVGVGYATDVGEIDLLARDNAGGLVAVLVAAPNEEGKDLVAGALERVGWVRKHVAEAGQEVRAIVVLEHAPDDLSYTAAAVVGTVSFKTCRFEVSFTSVDV